VALKFIGFSLSEINKILKGEPTDLATALRRQREVIEEKRGRLQQAISAIERAESVIAGTGQTEWEVFSKIIEVINMQTNMDWTRKYYSEEAKREIEKRAASIPAEVIAQAQRDWTQLIKEVEAAVAAKEDPTGRKAQSLAARWSELIKGFTGGNGEIQKGLNRMYADRNNWPASMPKPFGDEVQAFISKAMKCGKK
jgi:DNA-binding transcriptional MerR regulator